MSKSIGHRNKMWGHCHTSIELHRVACQQGRQGGLQRFGICHAGSLQHSGLGFEPHRAAKDMLQQQ
jgi:hypothetical protein